MYSRLAGEPRRSIRGREDYESAGSRNKIQDGTHSSYGSQIVS